MSRRPSSPTSQITPTSPLLADETNAPSVPENQSRRRHDRTDAPALPNAGAFLLASTGPRPIRRAQGRARGRRTTRATQLHWPPNTARRNSVGGGCPGQCPSGRRRLLQRLSVSFLRAECGFRFPHPHFHAPSLQPQHAGFAVSLSSGPDRGCGWHVAV